MLYDCIFCDNYAYCTCVTAITSIYPPASLFWWHRLYIVLLVVNAVLLLVSAVLWIVFGAVVDNPRGIILCAPGVQLKDWGNLCHNNMRNHLYNYIAFRFRPKIKKDTMGKGA